MSKYTSVEYKEVMDKDSYFYRPKKKVAQHVGYSEDLPLEGDAGLGHGVIATESPDAMSNSAMDVYYTESNADYAKDFLLGREGRGVGQLGVYSEDLEDYESDDYLETVEHEHFDYPEDGEMVGEGQVVIEGDDAEEVLEEIGKKLPGVDVVIVEEPEEDEDSKKETDWENDRDPKQFMVYISNQYPGGIPKHDGTSTLGCERAVMFLNKLNKEISEALRADSEDILDIPKLEDIRVNLVKDVAMLKDHIKHLNKKRNKRASEDDDGSEMQKVAELNKVASTPKINMVMTPFERAITGILTNAVVSAGKPFEDVYQFLKKKYSINEREELAIMQILRDMGHPIFKDRGTIGKSDKKDESAQGVDFIKNYFA